MFLAITGEKHSEILSLLTVAATGSKDFDSASILPCILCCLSFSISSSFTHAKLSLLLFQLGLLGEKLWFQYQTMSAQHVSKQAVLVSSHTFVIEKVFILQSCRPQENIGACWELSETNPICLNPLEHSILNKLHFVEILSPDQADDQKEETWILDVDVVTIKILIEISPLFWRDQVI